MISVGDLVECPFPSAHWLGLVFKAKTQTLDGVNEEKLFKIHFPNREQYWIPTDKLNKVA